MVDYDNKAKPIPCAIHVMILLVGGNFLCFLFTVIFGIIIQDSSSNMAAVICLWVSMFMSFCLFPYLYTKRTVSNSLHSSGIIKPSRNDVYLFIPFICGILAIIIYVSYNQLQPVETILYILFSQIGVALIEEFFSRGVIIHTLSCRIHNTIALIIISAIIFGLFMHTGSNIFENLLYRVPAGIFLAGLYLWRKNIWLAVIAHFTYNIFCLMVL